MDEEKFPRGSAAARDRGRVSPRFTAKLPFRDWQPVNDSMPDRCYHYTCAHRPGCLWSTGYTRPDRTGRVFFVIAARPAHRSPRGMTFRSAVPRGARPDAKAAAGGAEIDAGTTSRPERNGYTGVLHRFRSSRRLAEKSNSGSGLGGLPALPARMGLDIKRALDSVCLGTLMEAALPASRMPELGSLWSDVSGEDIPLSGGRDSDRARWFG